jgi:hypothetical protein
MSFTISEKVREYIASLSAKDREKNQRLEDKIVAEDKATLHICNCGGVYEHHTKRTRKNDEKHFIRGRNPRVVTGMWALERQNIPALHNPANIRKAICHRKFVTPAIHTRLITTPSGKVHLVDDSYQVTR